MLRPSRKFGDLLIARGWYDPFPRSACGNSAARTRLGFVFPLTRRIGSAAPHISRVSARTVAVRGAVTKGRSRAMEGRTHASRTSIDQLPRWLVGDWGRIGRDQLECRE